MEQRYKVLLKFFLNQGEKFCLVPNKKTCFCVMPSFFAGISCTGCKRCLGMFRHLKNAMGRTGQRYG